MSLAMVTRSPWGWFDGSSSHQVDCDAVAAENMWIRVDVLP